jgi:hypothetical protein
MKLLRHLVPGFVQRPYRMVQKRLDHLEVAVRCLEMAIDALAVSPKYVPGQDIGFNGQMQRKKVFGEVITAIRFDAIAETGTWLGNTTGYMLSTAGVPVSSCEISPRFHALAKMRLAELNEAHLDLSDS